MALVVRADFHWLLERRVKVKSLSPASARLSATALHFSAATCGQTPCGGFPPRRQCRHRSYGGNLRSARHACVWEHDPEGCGACARCSVEREGHRPKAPTEPPPVLARHRRWQTRAVSVHAHQGRRGTGATPPGFLRPYSRSKARPSGHPGALSLLFIPSDIRSDGRDLFRFRTAPCWWRARSSVWGAARSTKISRKTAGRGIVRGNLLELSGVLVLASVDEKPIPIFQDVTRGYPPGGDDVYPLPPVAAASRGPAS